MKHRKRGQVKHEVYGDTLYFPGKSVEIRQRPNTALTIPSQEKITGPLAAVKNIL